MPESEEDGMILAWNILHSVEIQFVRQYLSDADFVEWRIPHEVTSGRPLVYTENCPGLSVAPCLWNRATSSPDVPDGLSLAPEGII